MATERQKRRKTHSSPGREASISPLLPSDELDSEVSLEHRDRRELLGNIPSHINAHSGQHVHHQYAQPPLQSISDLPQDSSSFRRSRPQQPPSHRPTCAPSFESTHPHHSYNDHAVRSSSSTNHVTADHPSFMSCSSSSSSSSYPPHPSHGTHYHPESHPPNHASLNSSFEPSYPIGTPPHSFHNAPPSHIPFAQQLSPSSLSFDSLGPNFFPSNVPQSPLPNLGQPTQSLPFNPWISPLPASRHGSGGPAPNYAHVNQPLVHSHPLHAYPPHHLHAAPSYRRPPFPHSPPRLHSAPRHRPHQPPPHYSHAPLPHHHHPPHNEYSRAQEENQGEEENEEEEEEEAEDDSDLEEDPTDPTFKNARRNFCVQQASLTAEFTGQAFHIRVAGSEPLLSILRSKVEKMQEMLYMRTLHVSRDLVHGLMLPQPVSLLNRKVPLSKMSLEELRKFVPWMLKHETLANGRRLMSWTDEFRPAWWPEDLPFKNIRKKDYRTNPTKSFVDVLRDLVRRCYTHHHSEHLIDHYEDKFGSTSSPEGEENSDE